MNNSLKTTVVGSYPAEINLFSMMKQYFYGSHEDIWLPIIDKAVRDMISANIQIISDGQVRDPFIQLFTRHLNGCRVRDRTEIIDKIEYHEPIIVPDQQYVRGKIPSDILLKGVLTGPHTLSCSSVDLYYHDQKEMAYDFAYALHKEACALMDVVDFVSIDEPFFSQEFPEYAYDIIKIVAQDISVPVVLHVCGDVSKIVEKIVELPVDILSHEFKASPQLIGCFNNVSFSQKLCFGSVRSDSVEIESVEEIVAHIRDGLSVFGEKIIHVSPDCGLRLLPHECARAKLKNLSEAGGLCNE